MSETHHRAGFIHSIKVPKIYKTTSKIVQTVLEEGGSLKQLLYTTVKANLKGNYALITKTIQNNVLLDSLIEKTKILEENPQLNVWLAKILITELLLGKGNLQGESKPVQTVWSYREALKKEFDTQEVEQLLVVGSEFGKPRYVRVNTLRATCDEVIKELRMEGWELVSFHGSYSEFLRLLTNLRDDQFLKDVHIKDLLVFPPGTEFHNYHLYQNGTIILQDKASCLPPFILQPGPKNVVLDMCAAPGMKTTMLSALMRGKGKIYAVEINARRYTDMGNMVKTAGCENVTMLMADSLSLTPTEPPWCRDVEYILVDPTCSGSGMTERARLFTRPQTVERMTQLAAFQRKLLLHALTNFPSVRRVVYSTCSILQEENEEVVEAVLKRIPPDTWSVAPCLPDWPSRGSKKFSFGSNCVTARPLEDLTTGFFIALFEKIESEEEFQDTVIQNSKNSVNLTEEAYEPCDRDANPGEWPARPGRKSTKVKDEFQNKKTNSFTEKAVELCNEDDNLEESQGQVKKLKKEKEKDDTEDAVGNVKSDFDSESDLKVSKSKKRKDYYKHSLENNEGDNERDQKVSKSKKKKDKDVVEITQDLKSEFDSDSDIKVAKSKKRKDSYKHSLENNEGDSERDKKVSKSKKKKDKDADENTQDLKNDFDSESDTKVSKSKKKKDKDADENTQDLKNDFDSESDLKVSKSKKRKDSHKQSLENNEGDSERNKKVSKSNKKRGNDADENTQDLKSDFDSESNTKVSKSKKRKDSHKQSLKNNEEEDSESLKKKKRKRSYEGTV